MKKIIIWACVSNIALLGFAAGIAFDMIPLMVLMLLIYALCLLWFTEIIRQRYSRARRSARIRPAQEYYSIDIPLDEPEEDKPELKPAASNVRPGSRPSERYLKMVEGARA